MKIVCLVKQVPRADAIEFDPETKSLRREGVPLLLNPFDAAAVAQAAELKRQGLDGEVIAMTMGPPQAAAALRECLALGADRCIHLSDRVFAVADTLGTSRTLALAIAEEGDVGLVLCGRKSLDSETWQVPPETAAFLGWPHVTSVADVVVSAGHIRATRETEHGFDTYELNGPAVLSLAHARAADGARDGTIDVWTAADLVDDLRENDERADYLRATLKPGPDGLAVATPFPVQDSSMLAPLAKADCLLIREPYAPPAGAGDRCAILKLGQ